MISKCCSIEKVYSNNDGENYAYFLDPKEKICHQDLKQTTYVSVRSSFYPKKRNE